MTRRLAFPALRCTMGNWIYYTTCMSFADVAAWVKPTREIHDSQKLAEWIQRQLDESHAGRISKYLRTDKERLFNALVLGVFGAEPDWSELNIHDPQERLSAEDEDHLKRTVGILAFKGQEEIFAVDGQHRVAGIKRAVAQEPKLSTEEVAVILVAHVDSPKGRQRTRRLFTTLNKKAKKVNKADIVALDEDNGFAVVARQLVDDFKLLSSRDLIAFEGSANLSARDKTHLTSVIGLYEIAIDLYPSEPKELPSRGEFQVTRPEDSAVKFAYDRNVEFWTLLSKRIPEYRSAFKLHDPMPCGDCRKPTNNHLLFRPVGQRAFAGAVRTMTDRNPKLSMAKAIDALLTLDLWLHHATWHHLLWDPFQSKMLAANRVLAETHLLMQVKQKPRSDDAAARYDEVMEKKKNNAFAARRTRTKTTRKG